MAMRRRDFLRTAGATLIATSGVGALGRGRAEAAASELSGKVVFWDQIGPDDYARKAQADFQEAFKKAYPNVNMEMTLFGYGDYLDKLRLALRGNDPLDVVRLHFSWIPEIVNGGYLVELDPAKFGLSKDSFTPGAVQIGTRQGKFLTIPSSNECMILIYNKGLFKAAGFDPEKAPDTWEQVAEYSKQIKEKTGKFGYGMVARLNHGNTGFRILPVMWGYGGSIFDELDPTPQNKEIRINREGTIKALELYHRMYAVDKSVSPTALTDAQPEVSTQFLNGQVAMIIAHANDASDAKRKNPDLNVGATLMPKGPVRRAAVLGGFEMGLLKTSKNPAAAMALIKMFLDPEWLPQIIGDNSNPGTTEALRSKAQAERERRNPFHKPYKEMLAYGVVQPQVPQLATIWNEVIPTMLQEAITGKKTAKLSADDAAKSIADLMKA